MITVRRVVEEYCYVAVRSSDGRELTGRHYGTLWLGMDGTTPTFAFVGDEVKMTLPIIAEGSGPVTAHAAAGAPLLPLTGELVGLWRGGDVIFDTTGALDRF